MTHTPRHVVQFSTGIGSAEVAARVVAKHGAHNTTLLTADTMVEDPDNWRFAHQVHRLLGEPDWQILRDGRTPMEVGRDLRCVPNNRMAVCSRVLKRELLRGWIDMNCDPANTVIYLGFDWTEQNRHTAAAPHWQPYTIESPLCVPPYGTKAALLERWRDLGIEPPRLYAQGFGHANCFHPDTRFITDAGIKTLRDCLGKSVRVLGKGGGWHHAEIASFGDQPLCELRLKRYGDTQSILVTPNHLWPVRKAAGRTDYRWLSTSELIRGQKIAGIYGRVAHNVRPSAVGVAAGFTFGDGDAAVYSSGQNPPARAFLCGDKDQALMPYFAASRTTSDNRGVTIIHDLPRSWKRPPDLAESQSYLYGWLAGYFAADGCVSGGGASLTSATRGNLELVRDICARLGIGTNPIRTASRLGYGTSLTAIHTVALHMSTLRADFFVTDSHRARFESRPSETPRPADWEICEVIDTGRVEEVMCAVVPDGHTFALDGNILTHNCAGACVRGGQAQWELLLRVNRPTYLDWENEEETTRTMLGKDVTILRDRTAGESRPLSLRSFRERLDSQPVLFDTDDWGACGCTDEPPAGRAA